MNILDKIIAHKKHEVELRKKDISVKELERSAFFSLPVLSIKKSLLESSDYGIIAEYKRKSPSKGIINDRAPVVKTTSGYEKAGAAGLSILTDSEFFGGSTEDVLAVRNSIKIPILRKEFIIDEYQIVEAKSIGADVILLLANVLTPQEVKQFSTTAKWLGLEILLEVRERSELDAVNVLIDCVGVNNRNLKDFKVDINQSFELIKDIPKDVLKISESGIDSAKAIIELSQVGYQGFLMGESFMKHDQPELAMAEFVQSVKKIKS